MIATGVFVGESCPAAYHSSFAPIHSWLDVPPVFSDNADMQNRVTVANFYVTGSRQKTVLVDHMVCALS